MFRANDTSFAVNSSTSLPVVNMFAIGTSAPGWALSMFSMMMTPVGELAERRVSCPSLPPSFQHGSRPQISVMSCSTEKRLMSRMSGFPPPNECAQASRKAVAIMVLPVPGPPMRASEIGRNSLFDGGSAIVAATCATSASIALDCPWQVLDSSALICRSFRILSPRSFMQDFWNSSSAISCTRDMMASV